MWPFLSVSRWASANAALLRLLLLYLDTRCPFLLCVNSAYYSTIDAWLRQTLAIFPYRSMGGVTDDDAFVG